MRTYVRTYVGCQFHGDIVLLGGVQEYGQEEKTVPTMRLRMRACVYLQCADERANVRTDLAPVPSSPTAAVWARAFRFEQRCPFVPSLQPGYVRACVRTLHTRGRGRPEDLRMPWIRGGVAPLDKCGSDFLRGSEHSALLPRILR